MVQDAARAAVGLLAAGVLSGCMGGGEGQAGVDETRFTRPTQLVQCRDWNEANPQQRSGTLGQLRRFAGGPTGSPGGHGRELDDDKAYELFDRWCDKPYARGFRLYKLYTRAAAFSSVSE